MSENVLDPEIGIRVRRLRKLNHMTQAELAEAVGVSVKHISGVERGVSNLSLENLIKACKTLDTGLDYLVFGKTPLGNDLPLPESILEILRSGNEKDRKPLIDYLFLYDRIHNSH